MEVNLFKTTMKRVVVTYVSIDNYSLFVRANCSIAQWANNISRGLDFSVGRDNIVSEVLWKSRPTNAIHGSMCACLVSYVFYLNTFHLGRWPRFCSFNLSFASDIFARLNPGVRKNRIRFSLAKGIFFLIAPSVLKSRMILWKLFLLLNIKLNLSTLG